jgi:hypothetical protein
MTTNCPPYDNTLHYNGKQSHAFRNKVLRTLTKASILKNGNWLYSHMERVGCKPQVASTRSLSYTTWTSPSRATCILLSRRGNGDRAKAV